METIVMRKLFIIFSALLFLPALSDYAVRSGEIEMIIIITIIYISIGSLAK